MMCTTTKCNHNFLVTRINQWLPNEVLCIWWLSTSSCSKRYSIKRNGTDYLVRGNLTRTDCNLSETDYRSFDNIMQLIWVSLCRWNQVTILCVFLRAGCILVILVCKSKVSWGCHFAVKNHNTATTMSVFVEEFLFYILWGQWNFWLSLIYHGQSLSNKQI